MWKKAHGFPRQCQFAEGWRVSASTSSFDLHDMPLVIRQLCIFARTCFPVLVLFRSAWMPSHGCTFRSSDTWPWAQPSHFPRYFLIVYVLVMMPVFCFFFFLVLTHIGMCIKWQAIVTVKHAYLLIICCSIYKKRWLLIITKYSLFGIAPSRVFWLTRCMCESPHGSYVLFHYCLSRLVWDDFFFPQHCLLGRALMFNRHILQCKAI